VSISAALGVAAAAALLLAAWREPQRRAWAMVAVAGGVLYLALRGLPPLLGADERPRAESWNWGGHLLALAGMLALAALLVRRAGLSRRELGLAWPVHLGTAVRVCAAALLVSYPLHVITAGRSEPVPPDAWLFVATMPGLAEEVAFRGVLLAAAERAAPTARVIAGVPVTLGAALLTAAFVGLHGFGVGMLVSVLPGALLYLWLRLRTGSVLLPIIAHNLWNLTVLAAHL
jgi:membrane protease YdiL (CAAX protease family)